MQLIFLDGGLDLLRGPWHWAASGVAITIVMALMTWMGRSFGVSTAFKNLCNLAGAGRRIPFFDYDLKDEDWRFAFIVGAIAGGAIAAVWLANPDPVALNPATIAHLSDWGIAYPATVAEGSGYLPEELFNLGNAKGVIIAIIGGFLVGFGARYADGCTSGHAITGLSHMQLPSLLTVIGFFIGGLAMTWLIMPLIFG